MDAGDPKTDRCGFHSFLSDDDGPQAGEKAASKAGPGEAQDAAHVGALPSRRGAGGRRPVPACEDVYP